MSAQGSYQFEKLESRFVEAKMLAQRAGMRMEGFPDLLRRHAFPVGGRILEIGTAQGIRARAMLEHFPLSHVIGIDRSTELMSLEATGNPRLEFQHADVYELPFSDNSFDFVYARLVFMHLTDPHKALASIQRVLKPGGRVLIEDADRDCMFFEPAPASLKKFWQNVQQGQRRLGGDPNVGRKLATLLGEAGFDSVQTEVQTILGKGPEIEFLVKTLMPSLNIYLEPNDRMDGEKAIQDLYMLSQNELAYFYHFWFAVSGAKK